ncbi:MAG: hypothetical protein WCI27_01320 [Candidatus Omnitrophota bacterium]
MKNIFVILMFLGISWAGAVFCSAEEFGDSVDPRTPVVKAIMDTLEEEFAPLHPEKWDIKTKISGEVRTSFGVESNGQTVFNRSNADLNERNWRILSSEDLNKRLNTFDPAIYSRLKVVVDTSVKNAVAMHLNVTADPWSYTGKTGEVTVTSGWGDSARVQQLYWGNNGYTVNHSVNTLRYGGYLGLPEIKVTDGKVPATVMSSTICNEWGQCDSYNVPAMDVKYTFQPIRELWFDVKPEDSLKVRVFPMAYQDQALTTDEPIRLSNNRSWWEESPWLHDWRGGQVNHVTGLPEDYSVGKWDRGLAFATRDSDGTRLTALRGASVDIRPEEATRFQATVATPKTLWQDYSEMTAVAGSARLKHFVDDKAYVGATANMHNGYVDGALDKENYVGGVDGAYVPVDRLKVAGQLSTSASHNDVSSHYYSTATQGQAYYVSVEAVSSAIDILKTDYLAQKAFSDRVNFFKTKMFFGRMDKTFESSLSNYHVTRKDAFWSRHLTFYPSIYRNMPGSSATMSEADQEAFAIGNGLDYGRNVVGWRGDTKLMDGKVDGMADIRHVTTNDNRKIETVARTAWSRKVDDRLTVKGLLVLHTLPKTRAGEDPFIVNNDNGEYLLSRDLKGGEDRTLKTRTVGARYELTEWADVNEVWEFTNDSTLAEDTFPRGLFDGSSSRVYTQDGRRYRVDAPWLYDQGFFSQPKYPYYNIFKTGLHLKPTEIWDLYFDYTRNPNKFAGNIDDNMHHFGAETSFVPIKSLGFFARYTYSRAYNLIQLNKDKTLSYQGYHNIFLEGRYIAPKDNTFSLQYGVGPAYFVDTSSTNPDLSFYTTPVLETEHIIRMTYQKRF